MKSQIILTIYLKLTKNINLKKSNNQSDIIVNI